MALAPTVSEIRDLKSDLVHIRELLGVLVRKERSAEAKADIAARRLNRMERERDQENEAECEATLEEALADHSKVVKVIVDKWFVDKGFGFGKTPTGQVVFIHASAVQCAEVLKIGTDARVEVGERRCSSPGRVQSKTCLGTRRVESGEVRRAAALTAELAVQSEKKTAAVCDQPPGLDELAGHIEAPNMGAGGSHPQAAMMPDPWATYKCPSANNNQAETTASSETNRISADRGVLAQTRMFRGARLRSATRAPSTRSRGPNLTKEESQQRNPHRAGTASWSEERRSMGALPKATDSHAENKRKLRDEVQGESTGRHLQQQQGRARERLAIVDERAGESSPGRGTEAGGV